MLDKRVYAFNEGSGDIRKLLGGKGANLAEMTRLGFPVPPGFTITTEACAEYLETDQTLSPEFMEEVQEHLNALEEKVGKKFGDKENPLLVSIRSGAAISMPGMMDSVLNLGLNETTVEALIKLTDNERFAWDSFRRFIQMFGNIVKEIPLNIFEIELEKKKEIVGAKDDTDLKTEHLKDLVTVYKRIYKEQVNEDFPDDPLTQLEMGIQAVFGSWNNKRAINYRNHEKIPHDIYTAVNVQTMVYGNLGDDSATGVAFTRNPASGEAELFGEYLLNAQGEDVVSGIRTPEPIANLKDQMPEMYQQFVVHAKKLETHLTDMQDLEFTIEKNQLYILQTRTGKRTGMAAAKIAHDLCNDGIIDKATAVKRITPRAIENCLFPTVVWLDQKKGIHYDIPEEQLTTQLLETLIKDAPAVHAQKIGQGLPAGPGAASGHVVFDSDRAESITQGKIETPFRVSLRDKKGDPRLILVKSETSPDDFHGMVASVGILTMTGGMTSHAALVARQIGKRCVVGASSSGLKLRENRLFAKDGTVIKEGDIITLDVFDNGTIYQGNLPIFTPIKLPQEMETILDWADELAKIKVRTNADTRSDAQLAMEFKATGIGLARTEHQFFGALMLIQAMILAKTKEERQKYLDKMRIMQRKDFIELFQTANGKPVTIRLIDPPLHEFLPREVDLREKIWKEQLDSDSEEYALLQQVLSYQEANPMLGLRGCRLGLLFPELMAMQVQAIGEASLQVKAEGIDVHPEIMVPLVGFKNEFTEARNLIDATIEQLVEETNGNLGYKVGTMIEVPRAALTADLLAGGANGAEFFSFGTNDLHQMTLGFSRDDVAKFLPFYIETGIITKDPFQTIDEEGTGQIMVMCVEKGRKAAAEAGRYLKIGICGEHGGDPESIDFCYRIGLDYVSCAPFRVPIARLACAHATLNNPEPEPKFGKKLEN